jgi:tetratricopeptide (TPR) repeat protein
MIMIAAGCGTLLAHAADSISSLDYGSIELQRHSSFSRLLITLDESFKPKITSGKQGFEIHIPSANLIDIGIPVSETEGFNQKLASVADQRISKLRVKENNEELVIQGQYVFPKGKEALSDPEMEHFDFYKNENGKFVVDFWYKKGPTVIEVERQRKVELSRKKDEARKNILKNEEELKLAREKRIEESKSDLKFCEAPMNKENTIWVKYRAEHPILNFSQYISEFVPDHDYTYQEPAGLDEEKKMVRLAIKLSKENKNALAIKTVDFLKKNYPSSSHLDEMEFLRASSFYRLELFEQGKQVLLNLSKFSKNKNISYSAAAFLGMQSFKKQEWLSSLELFMNILRENPKDTRSWMFHYGAAESLYQIRQYDQARSEYEWLLKNPVPKNIKSEAGYKLGDLYFNRNQYAQAIQAYSSMIRNNPAGYQDYPHVFMNLGEAFFQLDEFDKADESFSKFLEHGRSMPNAWKASLRIAEIRSMKNPSDFEKNFTEMVNRHPMTSGAVIARLRMLPCGNHGGFDLISASRYIDSDEVKKTDDSGTFYTTSLTELSMLTEIRTLLSFGEDLKAIEKGVLGLRANPSIEVRRMIERGMVGGLKRLLGKKISEGDYYSAIGLYEKYGDYLPGPNFDPICDDLRLKIAKFASDKSLIALAMKLIEPYRNGDEIGLKNAANEIQKNLKLDSTDGMENRVLIEAKSFWNGERFNIKDEKESGQFLEKLSKIPDVSTHAFDRDLLKVLYFFEKGSYAEALSLAEKLKNQVSVLGNYSRAQTLYFFGEVAAKANEPVFAAKVYRESRVLAEKLSNKDKSDFEFRHFPAVPSISRLYIAEGEQLELQEKWKESVALYQQALENKIGGNHLLYAHARALLKEGGRESKLMASRSLEKIKQSQDDDVWKNLAQKALDTIAREGKENENRK